MLAEREAILSSIYATDRGSGKELNIWHLIMM